MNVTNLAVRVLNDENNVGVGLGDEVDDDDPNALRRRTKVARGATLERCRKRERIINIRQTTRVKQTKNDKLDKNSARWNKLIK